MQKIVLTAALILVGGAAFAGNVEQSIVDDTVFVPQALDWGGFYAGFGASSFTGATTYNVSDFPLVKTKNPVLFAGYRHDAGRVVYGAEIATLSGDVWERDWENIDGVTALFDIKATMGYEIGKFLPYVVLGYAKGDYAQGGTEKHIIEGPLFGIGLDYAVTDKFIMGLEYTKRDLFTDVNGGGYGTNLDTSLESIALKAAYRF